jgi:hypothetical protein
VPAGDVEERSERLAARVDALAAALRAAGVGDETASRLLASASTAALKALALELLVAEPAAARNPKPVPAAEPDARAEGDISLAA